MTLEAQLSEEEEEMFAECQKFDAFLKLLMTLKFQNMIVLTNHSSRNELHG